MIAALAAGCTPLDKKNPTDPKAGNYVGMHYEGAIGDSTQTSLSDFTVRGSEILALDKDRNMLYEYSMDGQTLYFGPDEPPAVFSAPTGICSDSSYIYIVDNSADSNIKLLQMSGSAVTVTAMSKLEPYTPFKCAVSASYLYTVSQTIAYRYNLPNIDSELTWDGSGPSTAPFSSISDIKVHTLGGTTEVLVVDSTVKRISIFVETPTIMYLSRKFDLSYNVKGIGVSDSYIYIPSDDGIHKIDYNTGAEIITFAGYGEGAGKVMQPGPCGVYGSMVLAGDGNRIKVFGP